MAPAPAAGAPPLGLVMLTGGVPIADSVALAFAVAASSFCPLLVLGIWWRGLTDVGAALGLIAGDVMAHVGTVLHGGRACVVGTDQVACADPECPIRHGVIAPLTVEGRVVGTLAAYDVWTSAGLVRAASEVARWVSSPEALGLSRTDPGQG